MAVESIGVTEQVDGVNVACMEATDDDSNKTEIRVIQQMDLVHAKKAGFTFGAWDRTVTSSDTTTVTNPIGSPHNGFVITVGDNSLLEVLCVLKADDDVGDAAMHVTPIILSATNQPLGVLPTKSASGIVPEHESVIEPIHYVDTDKYTICHPLTWWVGQYERIAFVLTMAHEADACYMWGRCHSGYPNDKHDMFTVNATGTIGGSTNPMGASGSAYTAGGG